MNKLEYLLDLEKKSPREVYDTWVSLGELNVTNKTKIYNKDTIFRINEECPMKNTLVYCNYTYTTNPESGFDNINWTIADRDSINNKVYFYQGVSSPNFTVVLSPDEFESIDRSVDTPDDFIPFKNCETKTSSISISDEEFNIIAAELGIPFVRPEELEYNKETLVDICIRPALDQYYAFFPIVIDEACGAKGSNEEYFLEYHNFKDNPSAVAYKGIPHMTMGNSVSASGYGAGAFNYMRAEFMSGGYAGNGMWGNGIRYSKAVPGYTGGADYTSTMMLNNAVRQGYANYFRREYERDVYKDGKKYVHGYTSVGGMLNVHWLCRDTVYEHIDYWMYPQVRKLCTAYALRNIGMLRSLIKPSDNSPIDFSLYLNRAEALEKEVLEDWKKNPNALIFAIKRGGLN